MKILYCWANILVLNMRLSLGEEMEDDKTATKTEVSQILKPMYAKQSEQLSVLNSHILKFVFRSPQKI